MKRRWLQAAVLPIRSAQLDISCLKCHIWVYINKYALKLTVVDYPS
jgi:hypothetical protein